MNDMTQLMQQTSDRIPKTLEELGLQSFDYANALGEAAAASGELAVNWSVWIATVSAFLAGLFVLLGVGYLAGGGKIYYFVSAGFALLSTSVVFFGTSGNVAQEDAHKETVVKVQSWLSDRYGLTFTLEQVEGLNPRSVYTRPSGVSRTPLVLDGMVYSFVNDGEGGLLLQVKPVLDVNLLAPQLPVPSSSEGVAG